MPAIVGSLIAALLPALADGAKGLIRRFTGGSRAMQPANVEEYVKVASVDVERLKALSTLDLPTGPVSAWVSNYRAIYRYVAATFIIVFGGGYIGFLAWHSPDLQNTLMPDVLDLVRLAFFYTFGDRVYRHL